MFFRTFFSDLLQNDWRLGYSDFGFVFCVWKYIGYQVVNVKNKKKIFGPLWLMGRKKIFFTCNRRVPMYFYTLNIKPCSELVFITFIFIYGRIYSKNLKFSCFLSEKNCDVMGQFWQRIWNQEAKLLRISYIAWMVLDIFFRVSV